MSVVFTQPGSHSEVGARNREVRFTPENGNRQRSAHVRKVRQIRHHFCRKRWPLLASLASCHGSGRNAATMVKPTKYIGNRLTAPGASAERSIGLRQGSRVSAPIALVALPGGSGGALQAGPERPLNFRVTERAAGPGNVGPTGIPESRSPCRGNADRFKTSNQRLRERPSGDCSTWPCASTYRCYGGH